MTSLRGSRLLREGYYGLFSYATTSGVASSKVRV